MVDASDALPMMMMMMMMMMKKKKLQRCG